MAVVAVAGYLAFKKGGILNTALPAPGTAGSPALPMAPFNPAGIAIEQPSQADIGVYTPSLDPTGQSLQLF